jgi:hypothetical protein
MAYVSSAFVEFRELLQRHVKQLQKPYPERYSTEWFFLRYVRRLDFDAQSDEAPQACNSAMRGLTRFYVDQVAEHSELAVAFEEILECHRYALRMERTRAEQQPL